MCYQRYRKKHGWNTEVSSARSSESISKDTQLRRRRATCTTSATTVLCFGLLLQRLDLGVFCLLIVQYVFVCISSLYGFIYLKAVAARASHVDTREMQEYNLWFFACLLVVSVQMSSMACLHL